MFILCTGNDISSTSTLRRISLVVVDISAGCYRVTAFCPKIIFRKLLKKVTESLANRQAKNQLRDNTWKTYYGLWS